MRTGHLHKLIAVCGILIFCFTGQIFSQASESFHYQAVARDAEGNPLSEKDIGIRLSILPESETADAVYVETHQVTTNPFGLVTLVVGEGDASEGDFMMINWGSSSYYMKVEIDLQDGNGYVNMGASRILSVPYALHAARAQGTLAGSSIEIASSMDASDDDPIFEVKNRDGQVVLGVYQSGVRIYVDEEQEEIKGSRAGFAVGGFTAGKQDEVEFLRVDPGSVRIMIDEDKADEGKGSRAGFAVGGFTTGKDTSGFDYFSLTPYSADFMLDETGLTKGSRAGFAVGGFSAAKGEFVDYMNITGSQDAEIINPAEPRILWYPEKEAFLAGRVLVEHTDSVGTNSWASGFESKSIGDWSQALGYRSVARGDYSTSIGKEATAGGLNSYAFGQETMASGSGSYAFGNKALSLGDDAFAIGRGTEASGMGSFAIGFIGLDSADVATGHTKATADWAVAIGMGAQATERAAFAIGTESVAEGEYSIALGYFANATGWFSTAVGAATDAGGYASTATGILTSASGEASTAMGWESEASGVVGTTLGYSTRAIGDFSTAIGISTVANGYASTAMGWENEANGTGSTAMGVLTNAGGLVSTAVGWETTANGNASTSMGENTTAEAYASLVTGRYNLISGSSDEWVDDDPLFVIGNGSESARSNAVTVLKNGRVGLQTESSPTYALQLSNSTSTGEGAIVATEYYQWSKGDKISEKKSLHYGLAEILNLIPVTYDQQDTKSEDDPFITKGSNTIGLDAREVFGIIPEAVSKPENEDTELWGISYSRLVPVLIKAIQEQQNQLDEFKSQQEQIYALQKENEYLNHQINQILQMLSTASAE